MNISPNVKIMTADEYAESGDRAFRRGVEYGKCEAEAALKAKPAEPIEVTMRCNFEFVESPPKPAKPQVELFCWGPQRATIEATLPGVRLRPVFSSEQMCGLKAGVWVTNLTTELTTEIPQEIWRQIVREGWVLLYINTCFARAKARNR